MDEIASKKLDELIEDSRALVAALEKKGDRSHELLAESLYKKRTHFITELLQNAEDEGARYVSFTLNENELIFSHDAIRLFDFDDIKSISNFGDNQKKKDKPNAIGRFGIGFKSVYSITDSPRIMSGDFDITIRNMCIPEKNNLQAEYYSDTKIILPLKDTKKESITLWLESEFQKLDVLCLLFLSNIKSIEWRSPGSKRKYEKIEGNNQITALKSDTESSYFLILDKDVPVDDKVLTVKIAFKLNEDKNAIIACNKSPLFAFFPTSDETNTSFLFHAPFHTTESRDTLNETDERNISLLNELGTLLAESLPKLKKRNLVNVGFLNMLPIDKNACSRSVVYSILYEAVKKEFEKDSNEFIPAIEKNTYCSVKDAMLPGSTEMPELLTEKQANTLFGRNKWITNDITENKTETKAIYQYLYSELNIPNYDLRAFATKLTEEFLLEQSNNWMVKFYKIVFQKAEGLWEKDAKNPVLRKKHIIRIEEQGKYRQVIPFADNGKPNVYLPVNTKTNYPTVLRSIANDKIVTEFLKALGLDYPDVFAEINEFILPKFKKGNMYDEHLNDIVTVLTAPKEKKEKYSHLINDLKESKCILGENYVTHEQKLLRPNDIYLPCDMLVKYFDGNPDVYFVVTLDFSDDAHKTKYKNLLEELGVEDESPRRIENKSSLTDDEKQKLFPIPYNYKYKDFCDYTLKGLGNFFENFTKERSIILWKMLINKNDDFFKGKVKYYYRYDYIYPGTFDAKFLRDMRKRKWLFVGENTFAPHEITFEELADDYKTDDVSDRRFAGLLCFRLDEDREYEEKHKGKKVINENEYDEYLKLKAEKEAIEAAKQAKIDDDSKFRPSVAPADAPIQLISYIPVETAHPYDENQGNPANNTNDDDIRNNNRNDTVSREPNDNSLTTEGNPQDNSEFIKDIGKWGEDYIYRVLSDECKNENNIAIIDLNATGKTGVGADFEIRRDDKFIKIVEVKTTTGLPGSPVIVSGTQWETARNFYNIENGDIYWIYCVYNAGTPNVQCVPIQNPIKHWKEGKIMADPVNFILKYHC